MRGRSHGSVRFDDYYKAQFYDLTSLCWRDVQRAHPTEAACRSSFDPSVAARWRVMTVGESGRVPGPPIDVA